MAKWKLRLELVLAFILTMAGIILFFKGFWVDPQGEIHQSIHVAVGEMFTFAGCLIGVDYSYRKIIHKIKNDA